MIIKTESGSLYHVDTDRKAIFRIRSERGPSPGWRRYEEVRIEVGRPMHVQWVTEKGDIARATVTTEVEAILLD